MTPWPLHSCLRAGLGWWFLLWMGSSWGCSNQSASVEPDGGDARWEIAGDAAADLAQPMELPDQDALDLPDNPSQSLDIVGLEVADSDLGEVSQEHETTQEIGDDTASDAGSDAPGESTDAAEPEIDLAAESDGLQDVGDLDQTEAEQPDVAQAGPEDATETGAVDATDTEDTGLDAGTDATQTGVDAGPPAENVLLPLPPQPSEPLLDITVEVFPVGGVSVRDCLLVGQLDNDNTDDFLYVTRNKIGTLQIRVTRLGAGGLSSKPVVTSVPFLQSLEVYGCALVDWDADGDDDLLLAGNPFAELFLNNGQGGFFALPDALPDLPTSSLARYGPMSLADFNNDGWVDVLFASLSMQIPCGGVSCVATPDDFECKIEPPPTDNPAPDRLLLRDPLGGMKDATLAFALPVTLGHSRPLATDLDGDWLPDLLQTADFGPTYALRNLQGSEFVPVPATGLPSWTHAMGWGQGDLDRDGDLDYVLSDAGPNTMLLRVGSGIPALGAPVEFATLDPTHPLQQVTVNRSTWSPMVEDWNSDGLVDIYYGVALAWQDGQFNDLANCLLPPDGLVSSDILALAMGTQPAKPESWVIHQAPTVPCGNWGNLVQAAVDVDGDNDLDIVQARIGCQSDTNDLRGLRNDIVQVGQSVRIRLIGPPHNRNAFGARLTGMAGPHLQMRVLHGQMGTGSQSTLVQHIGLGQATELTGVQVFWPDGKVSQVGNLKPGYHEIAYLP